MLLSLVASLALGTSLADLKLGQKDFEFAITTGLSNGLHDEPIGTYALRVALPVLSPEDRASLTREALSVGKAWLLSEDGRKAWAAYLGNSRVRSTAEQSASLNSSQAYWSTMVRERKPANPRDAEQLAQVTEAQRVFKANRPRLEREAATRARPVATPDEQLFNEQLKERIACFLAETKQMSWDAKLEEKNRKKRFVSATLEAKPNWWKFCWRAGPEATNAAREFATQWLAELNAPPASKLSDEK